MCSDGQRFAVIDSNTGAEIARVASLWQAWVVQQDHSFISIDVRDLRRNCLIDLDDWHRNVAARLPRSLYRKRIARARKHAARRLAGSQNNKPANQQGEYPCVVSIAPVGWDTVWR